jgi:hypothetical protein
MKQRKKTHAQTIANSLRGQLLISQALCIAVKVLRKQPKHLREVSNIADMEMLIEHVFPIYSVVEKAQEAKKHEDKKSSV